MQELAESEVTTITGLPDVPQGTVLEIDNNHFIVGKDGELHRVTEEDDTALSQNSIDHFWHRLGQVAPGKLSKHRRGVDLCTKTPTAMRREKNRARAKAAKQARKRNR